VSRSWPELCSRLRQARRGPPAPARVFLSEPNGVRARNAEALEVTEIFDPSATNVPEELRRRTGGIGVDVAVECSGNARALDDCVMSTRRGGSVVQTGVHVGPAEVRPMVWSENDLTIAGTWCYHVYDWPRIAAMIERGTFPVERIVTSRVGLEETVPGGFEVLVDPRGSEVKVLVEVG
jgi:(R,R)-butanediol dehydrogenase / meso-butanediol dehydrogenase / diacetyl reductase